MKIKNLNRVFLLFFSFFLLVFLSWIINNKLLEYALYILFFLLIFSYLLFSFREVLLVYFKDVKLELNNISWPINSDVRQSFLIILLIVFLASFILWIVDSFLTFLISKIL